MPLPPELQGRELTLSIPFHPGLDALVVDGVPAVSLQDDLVRGYRSRGPHEFRLPHGTAASVTLDLQVANTWTQAAWLDTVPRLHPSDERDGHTLYVRAVDDVVAAFAIGLLLQLAWVYRTVFREGKRRRAYVFFAVQISAASYIHFFYLGLSQGLLGTADVAFNGLLIPGAAVASVYFTHAQFELAPPSPVWLGILGLNVLAAIVFHGPFEATVWVGRTMILSLTVIFLYQLVTLGRLALRGDAPFGVKTVLGCWIVLALGSADDFPFWLGFGLLFGGGHGDIVALAIFATLQATNLAREHTASMQRGDELNATLAERVTALEMRERENLVLNAELQRQISDRSRQLFAALSFVGTATAEPTPRLAVGTRVQGRYRVIREIGEGGMGTVYEVHRVEDGRQLALKVTRRTDGPSLARLAREAHVAATIVHPHVVGVVDVDIATDGYLYIVLEYVDGPTLAGLRPRFGDVPWALGLLAQMGEGLQTLHDHGIVHRDFKPENVLVAHSDGVPVARVTDFGISRLTLGTVSRPAPAMPDPRATSLAPVGGGFADASADTGIVSIAALHTFDGLDGPTEPSSRTTPGLLTEEGVLVGTPVYMAPELADPAHPLTPAADVFGLGMVAYEMLARELPFRAPPVLDRLRGATVMPATSLRRAGKGQDSAARARLGLLPGELVTMIDAALDLDPSVRPSAGAFAEAMRAALRRGGDAGRSEHREPRPGVGLVAVAQIEGERSEADRVSRPHRVRRRRLELPPVDEGAVGRALVDQRHPARLDEEVRVQLGHVRVAKDDVAVGRAPDADALGEGVARLLHDRHEDGRLQRAGDGAHVHHRRLVEDPLLGLGITGRGARLRPASVGRHQELVRVARAKLREIELSGEPATLGHVEGGKAAAGHEEESESVADRRRGIPDQRSVADAGAANAGRGEAGRVAEAAGDGEGEVTVALVPLDADAAAEGRLQLLEPGVAQVTELPLDGVRLEHIHVPLEIQRELVVHVPGAARAAAAAEDGEGALRRLAHRLRGVRVGELPLDEDEQPAGRLVPEEGMEPGGRRGDMPELPGEPESTDRRLGDEAGLARSLRRRRVHLGIRRPTGGAGRGLRGDRSAWSRWSRPSDRRGQGPR